ncbi:MAG TPA: hypothetical protein VK503_02250 [Candidatus Bathyarchaeia archaeon]|nr:hypothetical protein [Candidatus Bathyarchaeia archaeon]
MKRTATAFIIFAGLTATMIGFFLDEPQLLSTILRSYIMQLL